MVKKVLTIFGTRPEAIKMAPVVKELEKHPGKFESIVCVTGQHREMLDQVLGLFGIVPDIDLALMTDNQSLGDLTARAMARVTEVLARIRPDVVLVQGDTTTAMVAALAAFYQKIEVGHVEAGLRTGDKHNPFPEEVNRQMISVIADYHFAPTGKARQVLCREGIDPDTVFFTGNTVVDALRMVLDRKLPVSPELENIGSRRLILVTAHRRENFGRPMENICAALVKIIDRNPGVELVYPVHLNPNVQKPVYDTLGNKKRIHLLPPVEYQELAYLMDKSYLVLTDSGGIQEEAPVLGKPVLVLRKETERPEGVEAQVVKVIGTDVDDIVIHTERLLNDRAEYDRMSKAVSPYGDGRAAQRIIKVLDGTFSKEDEL